MSARLAHNNSLRKIVTLQSEGAAEIPNFKWTICKNFRTRVKKQTSASVEDDQVFFAVISNNNTLYLVRVIDNFLQQKIVFLQMALGS